MSETTLTITKPTFLDKIGGRIVIAIFLALVIDGIDLQMLSLALPSLSKELNLSNLMAGSLATYSVFGMIFGGVLAGVLADKFGRIKVLVPSIILFSVATFALGFTHSYWEFAIVRLISGFGISALSVLGPMTASEFVPTKSRTTILGFLQAGWSVGYVIAALLSSLILPSYGWRWLFIIAIVPGVLCILLFIGLKESPSYIKSRALEKENKEAGKKEQNKWAMIFKNKSILITLIMWSVVSIALQAGYHGANTWLPSYIAKDLGINFKSAGLYLAVTYASMIIGKLAAGALADKFGRKKMWVITGVLTAIAFPLVMLSANINNVIWLLPVFGLLYGAPFAINHTYMCESFPTEVRGTAVGISYNAGRLGAILSPLIVGFVSTTTSFAFAIGLLGIGYAICAIIPGLFIKEKMYDPSGSDVIGH